MRGCSSTVYPYDEDRQVPQKILRIQWMRDAIEILRRDSMEKIEAL